MASEREQAARIGRELNAVVEGAVRDISIGVLTNAAASTPVDTGATQSSWRAAARPAGPVVKRTAAAIAASMAAQVASGAKLAAYRLGPKVFIGSAQPGIEQLNSGSSRREPAAFVQRAIAKALTTTRVLTLTTGRGRR